MTTGRSYLTLNDVRLFPKIPNTLALVLIFSEADARMSRDTHVSFLTLSNLRLSTSSALVFVYDHFGVVFYFFLFFCQVLAVLLPVTSIFDSLFPLGLQMKWSLSQLNSRARGRRHPGPIAQSITGHVIDKHIQIKIHNHT